MNLKPGDEPHILRPKGHDYSNFNVDFHEKQNETKQEKKSEWEIKGNKGKPTNIILKQIIQRQGSCKHLPQAHIQSITNHHPNIHECDSLTSLKIRTYITWCLEGNLKLDETEKVPAILIEI